MHVLKKESNVVIGQLSPLIIGKAQRTQHLQKASNMKVFLKHIYNSWQLTKLPGINMKKKNMFIEAFGDISALTRKLAGPTASLSPALVPWKSS